MGTKTVDTGLQGKVVAITGGARGIGYETASMLLRYGAKVAIGDIDEVRLKEAAEELRLTSYARLDVTDPESFTAFLDQVEKDLGTVDVVINNAGIMPTGRFEEQSDQMTRRLVEINVLGVMFGTKIALQRMLPRRRGHIINIGSLAGEGGFPGIAPYCGTKFAVNGFTEAVRLENLGSGVDISCVMPTFTNTELVTGTAGVKGFSNAEPGDIAQAIAEIIQKPRAVRRVTRIQGALVTLAKVMPRKLGEFQIQKLGIDKVFLDDVDVAARSAYEERIKND